MTFTETKTLVDKDSKVRIDVESMARITLSDIEFILTIAALQTSLRHKNILYETAVSKTAAVFQLAMRACDYLENPIYKKDLIERTKKGNSSELGMIGKLREENFHNGQRIIASERFYQFVKIKGCGYVGIYIYKGAVLNITGVHTFNAESSEYAITSEGIFEISNSGTPQETWKMMNISPQLEAVDHHLVINVIKRALDELKVIWNNLREIRVQGDGDHEYSYLNENGSMELLEKGDEGITSYQMGSQLRVRGNLTVTPPDGIAIEESSIAYFLDTNDAH